MVSNTTSKNISDPTRYGVAGDDDLERRLGMHRNTLSENIRHAILSELHEHIHDVSIYFPLNPDPLVRTTQIVISRTGLRTIKPLSRTMHLPCWLPCDHVFPEQRMLQFMGLGPPDKRRAKPEDWIRMAREFTIKTRQEFFES